MRPIWATPQVILPSLALLASLAYLASSGGPRVGPPPEVNLGAARAAERSLAQAELVVLDTQGLARTLPVELRLPEDRAARWQTIVGALRERMLAEGGWPEALGEPTVYALTVQLRAAAVVDLPDAEVALDVAQEERLLGSLERTLRSAGAERVAFLRGGRALATPLGHVRVRSGFGGR